MSPPLVALLEAEGLAAACAAKLAAAGVETIEDLEQLSEAELLSGVSLALMHAKKLAKAAKAATAAKKKKKELSAEEQKKQNEALYWAARNGEMGKLEAAIAAGAEVDWHNPDRVSELSELE